MRNHIDKNILFGEIKMWNDGTRKKQVGVLVESKANEKIFGKFFKNTVFFYGNGWETTLETIQEVNKFEVKGVLAIIDADFKRITNNVPTDKNLFLTDHHDTEIMMINSRGWNNVVHFYADTSISKDIPKSKLSIFEEEQNDSLKNILLKTAHPIACIRLLNEQEKLGLKFKTGRGKNFKHLNYSKFINQINLTVDIDKLKTEVENKSTKPDFFKDETINEKLNQLLSQEFDLLELCNGHDVINILSYALEKAINNKASSKKIKPEQIEDALVIAYRCKDFQQTNLYQSLRIWDNNHASFSLFN